MVDELDKLERLNNLENEVHVWFCSPDDFRVEAQLNIFKSVLSAEELGKYNRFNFEQDKQSYLVTHAMLRLLLAECVDTEASKLNFSVGEHGKPELKRLPGANEVYFNISHTHGLSVCAISMCGPLGVDAEHIKRKNNFAVVAQRMFSEQEQNYLKSSENAQQDFYYLWTLREAYVKALGTGLSDSVNKFYFEMDADGGDVVVKSLTDPSDGNNEKIKGWQFNIYQPLSDYVVSLAYESLAPVTVKFFEFPPTV